MTEKGILVSDAATGESVACRDAVETDNDSNARIIQRVDIGKGPLPSSWYNAGTLKRIIMSADGYELHSWPAAVFSSALTIGDKSTLVVLITTDGDLAAATKVLPVVLDSDDTTPKTLTVKGCLTESADLQTLQPVHASYEGDLVYFWPLLTWDVTGAKEIGLIVPVMDTVEIELYAALI